VYAADMFTRFQEHGVFSKQVGAELRAAVLAPVALYDGLDMLVKFLGRKPNPDSFLISVGAKLK
jgi:oligopeptidase A